MQTLKKFMQTEAFLYLVFGVLTTLIYYVFMEGSYILLQNGAVSEAIGQMISIIFAFYTNKKWVFKHKSNHVFLDFLNFSAARLIFAAFAVFVKWWFINTHPEILMNFFHLHGNVEKALLVAGISLFVQALNILINYFYSKFLVFRKPKNKMNEL